MPKPVLDDLVVRPVLERAFAPSLSDALAGSDIVIKAPNANVKALPVRAVVDENGQPALMRIPVETRQEISPFCFLVDTNAYMFDIPDNMRRTHILIRMKHMTEAGRCWASLPDSAYDDQFYYQPRISPPRRNEPTRPGGPFMAMVSQERSGGRQQPGHPQLQGPDRLPALLHMIRACLTWPRIRCLAWRFIAPIFEMTT
jgi:hypothetical protein